MSIKKTSSTLVIAGRGTSSHDTRVFQRSLKPNPDIFSINGLQPNDWPTTGSRYGVDLHDPQHMPNSNFYRLATQNRVTMTGILRRVHIDVDGIVKHFDCGFLPNTLCILMAKAYMMGYKTIVMPGIDTFAFEHDPIPQEAGFAFWLGYLKEKGVKVITSTNVCRNQTDLNRHAFFSGKTMALEVARGADLKEFLKLNENIYR